MASRSAPTGFARASADQVKARHLLQWLQPVERAVTDARALPTVSGSTGA